MKNDIKLKTSIDVAHLRKPGRCIERLFREITSRIHPGVTVLELSRWCADYIQRYPAEPALLGYNGYPAPVCVSVNHVAAHGIPNEYKLREGDLVTLDTAVSIDGWYCDGAWTFPCGKIDENRRRLIKAAWQATAAGIEAAKAGSRSGDIGAAILRSVRSHGCSVIKGFVGHGIGCELHEEPSILPFGEEGVGQPIVPGMVFTVEPIVTLGNTEVKTLNDGWTVVTEDGSLAAQFEQTVAVFSGYTEVLTYRSGGKPVFPAYPPF